MGLVYLKISYSQFMVLGWRVSMILFGKWVCPIYSCRLALTVLVGRCGFLVQTLSFFFFFQIGLKFLGACVRVAVESVIISKTFCFLL